jgi:hypothetical protein
MLVPYVRIPFRLSNLDTYKYTFTLTHRHFEKMYNMYRNIKR